MSDSSSNKATSGRRRSSVISFSSLRRASLSMPRRPSVSNVETFHRPATFTTEEQLNSFSELMEATQGMTPEQVRTYLANHKTAENRLNSRRSSGSGVKMAGADWFFSIGGASSQTANAGEYDGKE